MQKAGRFDFNILPLLKNPLFVASLILGTLLQFFLRLYRLLSLVIASFIFALSWSYFISSSYDQPKSVPFENWWILVGIAIFLIASLLYLWLVGLEKQMWKKFVCIHCHFYQPPREDPWLEEIAFQRSAWPYHDWNERITAECYLPNAYARRVDGQGRIIEIVNNYEGISFNFGPTLLLWLEKLRPEFLN